MTLQELIDTACFLAEADGMNKDAVAQLLVPQVFQAVAASYAADPQKASLLARDHTITLTNGVGTIPAEVLTQCKYNATVTDDDDATVRASLVRTWNDFISPSTTDRLIARWTIKDDTIYWVEVAADYETGAGKDGDVTLNIPTVPAVPATAATVIDAPQEVLSDIVVSLTQRLQGKKEMAA